MVKKSDKEDFLTKAKQRLKTAIEADDFNRKEAVETLRFKNGEQWETSIKQERDQLGQPTLQINVLDKYSKQVVGEMRKNKVKIKVRPVDSEADINIAKIREGIIYNIEYLSGAESIYDQAGKMLVDCGYGAWRVLTRYAEENPFLKEIYLEAIPNPLSVYYDPDCKDANHEDAEYCFIISNIDRNRFAEKYGKDKFPKNVLTSPGGGGDIDVAPTGTLDEGWYNKDSIRVVEYFYKERVKKKKALLSTGQIMDYQAAQEYVAGWESTYAQAELSNPGEVDKSKLPEIVQEREVDDVVIKWALLTSADVLDEETVPGKFIPVVLVLGEKTNIEGKTYISGLFKNAKDPQRMLNYWHTSAAEAIALAPKQPWLLTPKMIEGFSVSYANAHKRNVPYLLYNIDPANPGATPIRNNPGQVPAGIFAEIARAEQNIKDTIGMYNADIGDQGRELSGAAILARQTPGDTSTYVFIDNLIKGVAYGGRIINDMIPYIYDTERDARIRSLDESESFVPINTTVATAMNAIQKNPEKYSGMDTKKLREVSAEQGTGASFNDISAGKYGVMISTGPSFSTQRTEAASYLAQMAPAFATMSPVDKYFIVKNLDFPGADEYAEAVRKTVPPSVLPLREGEEPPPPPPPDPRIAVEQAKLEVQKIERVVQVEKMKTERARQQVALVKMLAEAQQSDVKVRSEIQKALTELEKQPVIEGESVMVQ